MTEEAPKPGRKKWVWIVGMAAALLLAASAGWFYIPDIAGHFLQYEWFREA